jgi:hypothetical protein
MLLSEMDMDDVVLRATELPQVSETSEFLGEVFTRTNQLVARMLQIQGQSRLLVVDLNTARPIDIYDLACLVRMFIFWGFFVVFYSDFFCLARGRVGAIRRPPTTALGCCWPNQLDAAGRAE